MTTNGAMGNDDDASNDSDVQCVDSDDNESVNDNLSKKLQRLHVDDRVNVPDENGKCTKSSLKTCQPSRQGQTRERLESHAMNLRISLKCHALI